ncbi:MAG: ester cyclase [Acidobacteria bacterium]|nr:ester cyclase [Acidobacteriota bacterium]
MSKEQNIQAQVRFGESVVRGKLEGLREVVDAKAFDHDPGPGQGLGPEGFIHYFSQLREAFPDLNITGEKLVADDDNVAIAYTITGTHQGDFMGIAPTGRKISARGVQIARFENGKLVERWGSSDQLGILQQIGVKAAGA